MFISPAFAQDVTDMAADAEPSFITSMLPLILIFFVFYVMIIRPQNKRMQEHRSMIGELRRGDRVVTGGGLIGTVKKLMDEEVSIEVSPGVNVNVVRSTIMTIRAKTSTKVANDEKPKSSKSSKSKTAKKSKTDKKKK